jgi:hypothetical protein
LSQLLSLVLYSRALLVWHAFLTEPSGRTGSRLHVQARLTIVLMPACSGAEILYLMQTPKGFSAGARQSRRHRDSRLRNGRRMATRGNTLDTFQQQDALRRLTLNARVVPGTGLVIACEGRRGRDWPARIFFGAALCSAFSFGEKARVGWWDVQLAGSASIHLCAREARANFLDSHPILLLSLFLTTAPTNILHTPHTHNLTYAAMVHQNGTAGKGDTFLYVPPRHRSFLFHLDMYVNTSLTREPAVSLPSPLARATPTRSLTRSPTPSSMPASRRTLSPRSLARLPPRPAWS